MVENIAIAIDIGSSSVRCSAYQNSSIIVSSSRTSSSTESKSGKINLEVLDWVEECVDETLQKLQQGRMDGVKVVAVGFASFAMNLVGIDIDGNIVGPEATTSYACSSDAVAEEVDSLKR